MSIDYLMKTRSAGAVTITPWFIHWYYLMISMPFSLLRCIIDNAIARLNHEPNKKKVNISYSVIIRRQSRI